MHNAAFAELGLNIVYVAHDVRPKELEQAMSGIRALRYLGLSITIPHKVAALHWVDELDPVAREIGCINTVVNRQGVLTGYNSDGLGALGALRAAGVEPQGQEVALLGSGGAARAIAVTLAVQAPPKRLTLLGVDEPELLDLAQALRQLQTTDVRAERLKPSALVQTLGDAQLLMQTTPVGMAPDTEQSLVHKEQLHPGLTVFDAVYTPRKTKLLRDAESRGCRVIAGLEMFLGQALVQFELFTGQPAPQQTMRRIVEQQLG